VEQCTSGRSGSLTGRAFLYGTVAVFLSLCALWLWCRAGGSSLIRIVAVGDEVKAYFNGRLIAEGRNAGVSREGGIGVWYEHGRYWGIPVPQTLESARVTDNASGALLFEQDFRRPLSGAWAERPASYETSRTGFRGARTGLVRLCTGPRAWKDYTLELRVRNCTVIEVAVRYRDPASYVVLLARPFLDVDSGLTFVTGGAAQTIPGGVPYCPVRMVAKNILYVFIAYFPWCVLTLATLGAAGLLLGFAAARLTVPRALEAVFVILLFAGGFAYLSWITRTLLDGIPHVPDSVAYNFQAQTLSRGALYSPAPPTPPSFEFAFLIVRDGKWFGQYPWGHPLLLMVGHLVHMPWISPPLVGASVLVLIYLIARELFSREVAAVSALLAFFSPFFQVNASNFMSHSSASFYLALGIFFLIRAARGGRGWWGFLSGLALGLLFNTRTLNAVPAIMLSLLLLLYFACRGKARWGSLAGFCVGGLLMAAFFLYANYVLMGHPLHPPYALGAKPISFFGASHPLGAALLHYYTLMTLFLMVIFGWPPVFTTGFFLAFLLLSKRDVWSVFLLLLFFGMTVVNTLNPSMISVAHMYGPRYVYEPFFVFIIMVACGWDRSRRLLERGIEVFASACPRRARVLSWLAHAAFLALPAALVFGAQQKWLSRSGGLFNVVFMPATIYEMKGFNYTSGAMLSKIRSHDIHHALIFVEDRDPAWWLYGAVFTLNSPFLDSDIIVARDCGPQENQKVIAAFPGRKLYRVNVQRQEIRDYG
jgi:hypothetical protein